MTNLARKHNEFEVDRGKYNSNYIFDHMQEVLILIFIFLYSSDSLKSSKGAQNYFRPRKFVFSASSLDGMEPESSPRVIPFDTTSAPKNPVVKVDEVFDRSSFVRDERKVSRGSGALEKSLVQEESILPLDSAENEFDFPTLDPSQIRKPPVSLSILDSIFIPSEYDSFSKRQAKIIVSSITFLSFIMGAIFTVLWYAVPGGFIHKNSPTSISSASSISRPYTIIDADKLLSEEFGRSGGEYFKSPAVVNDDVNANPTVSVEAMLEGTTKTSPELNGIGTVTVL